MVSEVDFAPGTTLPWHAHPDSRLCILLRGTYTEHFASASHQLAVLDLDFKPANYDHRTTVGDGGASCLVVQLAGQRGTVVEGTALERLRGPLQMPRRRSAGIAERLRSELYRSGLTRSAGLEAACLELVVDLVRSSQPRDLAAGPPDWLIAARSLLDLRFDESLPLKELAGEVGIHRVHLAASFRRWFGVTIGEYRRQIRLRRAAAILVASDRRVADVAVSCGFYDESHFIRLFREFFGTTPSRYRLRQQASPQGPIQ